MDLPVDMVVIIFALGLRQKSYSLFIFEVRDVTAFRNGLIQKVIGVLGRLNKLDEFALGWQLKSRRSARI